ncbi:hypothetical protein B0H11DRAFT_2086199 [Mycena galericulata]|nr:hypothetical protein B0H11DRAFT_2086199 [Mycena galericulata]
MDTFNEIYAQLSTVLGVCDTIGMEKGMQFVRLAARLKDTILAAQPTSHDAADAPEEISDGIRSFLGSAIDLPAEYIDGCWKAFGSFIWTYDENGKTQGKDAEAFKSRRYVLGSTACTWRGCSSSRLPAACSFGASNCVLKDRWAE